MGEKTTLVDAIYINNSGGKVLLDYLINTIIKKGLSNKFYFLLDPRGKYNYLDKIEYEFGKSSEFFRYQFYKKNKSNFSKVFCFGNVPPPIKLKNSVCTYFHNLNIVENTMSTPSSLRKKIRLLYHRLRSRFTNYYYVQTSYGRDLLVKNLGIDASRVKLFPFFMESLLVRKTPKAPVLAKDLKFLYVSSGAPHKNHLRLLNVWELLFVRGYNNELHLTVDESSINIVNKIKSLKSKGVNIINHGYTDVNNLYNKCDTVVFPSLTESFGLGLVESAQFGLDVLGADLNYTYEVIEPTLVFNPLDVLDIEEIIIEYINAEENKSTILKISNKIDEIIKIFLSNE